MNRWYIVSLVSLFLSSCAVGIEERRPLRYLALGDSYTIGEGVAVSERWPIQLKDALAAEGVVLESVEIVARTGWTTAELQEGLEGAGVTPPYQLVSLLIGVNDQYRGLDQEAYKVRFEQLLKQGIEYSGGDSNRVIVVSIPDYGLTPFGQRRGAAEIGAEIDLFNSINEEIALSYGVNYVDITMISREFPTLLAEDQLHPSGEMYQLWVEQILPVAYALLQ